MGKSTMNRDFPTPVLEEASRIQTTRIQDSKVEVETGITIDDVHSRDLDDAVNITWDKNEIQVRISISNPAELLSRDSQILTEALNRIETRYLPQENIPMLPRDLSEDAFSLLPSRKRWAITFIFYLNPKGEVIHFQFKKSLFKSRLKLSYAAFDSILENHSEDKYYPMLRLASQLGLQLLNNRRARGALAIYDLRKMIYTNEEGIILPLQEQRAHLSNIFIQEMMILVNSHIAQWFARENIPVLFRNHTAAPNAPGREEIIAQFNAALLHPDIIAAVSQRTVLWFRKATYDPILKGHFGLNVPAYTHITSPIRRVADLINIMQLNAYLSNKPLPFSLSELQEIAQIINQKTRDYRFIQQERFKEVARQRAQSHLLRNQVSEFVAMPSSEFEKVLKEAFRNELFHNTLVEAIQHRIKIGALDVNHLIVLLFPPKKNETVNSEITSLIFSYLQNHPELAPQILNHISQKRLFENLSFEEDIYLEPSSSQMSSLQTSPLFKARVCADIQGKRVSTANYAYGNSKKSARQNAAVKFLIAYLKHQLVSASDTTDAPSPQKEVQNKTSLHTEEQPRASTNYVGIVNELFDKYHLVQKPGYEFMMEGPSHHPRIVCKCTVEVDGETLKIEATGGNKKMAKQEAARKLLEVLEKKGYTRQVSNRKLSTHFSEHIQQIVEFDEGTNYVGLLQEYCQKQHIRLPEYTFFEINQNNLPFFQCQLKFFTPNEELIFWGEGPNKKLAKHDASFECLKYLLKSEIEIPKSS